MEVKIIELIQKLQDDNKNRKFFRENKDKITEEIQNILDSDSFENLISIIPDDEFYKCLADLYSALLGLKIKTQFLARLWYKMYLTFNEGKRQDFLNMLLSKEVDTFDMLSLLQDFLANPIDLPAEFIIEWFLKITKFVEKDMSAFKFYNAVESYTKNNSTIAEKILTILLDMETSEVIHNLISIILGKLRLISLEKIEKIDNELKNSKDITKQKCYYSSITNTYDEIEIKRDVLNGILDDILNSNYKEIESQAFYIAYRLHLSNVQPSEIKDFIIGWMLKHTGTNLSDISKHYCLIFAQGIINDKKTINNACKIITNIQPLNPESQGSFETLRFILSEIIETSPEKFNGLFKTIIQNNNPLAIFEEKDYFIDTFAQKVDNSFFTELFISKNLKERIFAQRTYTKFNVNINLNKGLMKNIDDRFFELMFKETLLKIHYGDIFARFISDINGRIGTTECLEFQKFLDIEITHQCLNYAGNCFEMIKKIKNPCDLIKNCITKVEKYFDTINQYKDSPVNSFSFPSSYDAAVKGLAKQSKEIREQTEKASVFMSLCSSVEILYGNKHSHRTSEGISESSDFNQLSHSVEIPILTMINPISEIFKNHEIKNDIRTLREKIANAE